MTERHNARRHRMSTRERQMLAAAYLPVIALGAVLITARTSHTRRRPRKAAAR